ncbi:pyridoxamine 5'-phosphate oxidase family protein [Lentisphaerota bacterium WC36G]|nr:pyridoxamine 5'-phosphate oxidase family protein [Lentisphaerae bacterium WC36]
MRMRREEKDNTNEESIQSILTENEVCHLALVGKDLQPYVLPMNFVHIKGVVFMHSARSGRKIDMIKNNSKVCLEIYESKGLRPVNDVEKDAVCNSSTIYRSLIANGEAGFVTDLELKQKVLTAMCDKMYRNTGMVMKYKMTPRHVEAVCLIAVKLSDIKVKQTADWEQ